MSHRHTPANGARGSGRKICVELQNHIKSEFQKHCRAFIRELDGTTMGPGQDPDVFITNV